MSLEALIRSKIQEKYNFGDIIFSDELFNEYFIGKINKKTFMNVISKLCKNTVTDENNKKIKELYRLGKGVYYSSFNREKNIYQTIDDPYNIIKFFTIHGRGVCVNSPGFFYDLKIPIPKTKIIYTNILPRKSVTLTENIPGNKIDKIELRSAKDLYFSKFKKVLITLLYNFENIENIIENLLYIWILEYRFDNFYEAVEDRYINYFYFPTNTKIYSDLYYINKSISFKKKTYAHLQDFINYMYFKNQCLGFGFAYTVNFRKPELDLFKKGENLLNEKTQYNYFSKEYLTEKIKLYKNKKNIKNYQKLKKRSY